MSFIKYVLFVWILFSAPKLYAQCNVTNTAFQSGEIIKYDVYYNWGFVWLNAGYAEFKIIPGMYKNRKIYHLKSFGSSHSGYDFLFKVRDSFESYVDSITFSPLWFNKNTSEGGFVSKETYKFNYISNKIYAFTGNSKRPFTYDTLSLSSCTYDVLSLIYYCRNIDFKKYKTDERIPVKAIIDNEVYDLYLKFKGTENINTKDGKKYFCYKFTALLVEGTIFKGGEDLKVWVTADENRIPVLVEAKILVGSVKAYLANYSGNRYMLD